MASKVVFLKKPDDPMCMRASIGGATGIGYYLTYRGELENVVEMLRAVIAAAEEHLVNAPPDPVQRDDMTGAIEF